MSKTKIMGLSSSYVVEDKLLGVFDVAQLISVRRHEIKSCPGKFYLKIESENEDISGTWSWNREDKNDGDLAEQHRDEAYNRVKGYILKHDQHKGAVMNSLREWF